MEVDPAEEEELDTLRAWRAEVGGVTELSTVIRDDFKASGRAFFFLLVDSAYKLLHN